MAKKDQQEQEPRNGQAGLDAQGASAEPVRNFINSKREVVTATMQEYHDRNLADEGYTPMDDRVVNMEAEPLDRR